MSKSALIFVSGLPATGKTSLSRDLSQFLKIPLINKDSIKEILFDTMGHSDRAWGEKLNQPTYAMLTYVVERQLVAGRSLLIESPFDADFPRSKLAVLHDKFSFHSVQIMCYTAPATLVDRFTARIGTPDRHPGHNDLDALEDFKQGLKKTGKLQPLDLPGKVIELDTTDFTSVDIHALCGQVLGSVEQAGVSTSALIGQ